MTAEAETPYTSGEVLEPVLSITPESLYDWPGPEYFERERFGEVNFENNNGDTLATVQVVRNDNPEATAPYKIRIDGNPTTFDIEWITS